MEQGLDQQVVPLMLALCSVDFAERRAAEEAVENLKANRARDLCLALVNVHNQQQQGWVVVVVVGMLGGDLGGGGAGRARGSPSCPTSCPG